MTHAGLGVWPILIASVSACSSSAAGAPTGDSTTFTFSTSDSSFRGGDANQGWYASRTGAQTASDNYLVGKGGQLYRNFFTFDLSTLDGSVVSATLRLRRARGRVGPVERLRLFHVTTSARALNQRQGRRDRAIYKDLGAGRRYGTFRVRTDGRSWDVVEFSLNGRALADIQAAEGAFFSIGSRLLSIDDRGALFGNSDARGPQELVVDVAP
jgi:hypothetical protein